MRPIVREGHGLTELWKSGHSQLFHSLHLPTVELWRGGGVSGAPRISPEPEKPGCQGFPAAPSSQKVPSVKESGLRDRHSLKAHSQ